MTDFSLFAIFVGIEIKIFHAIIDLKFFKYCQTMATGEQFQPISVKLNLFISENNICICRKRLKNVRTGYMSSRVNWTWTPKNFLSHNMWVMRYNEKLLANRPNQLHQTEKFLTNRQQFESFNGHAKYSMNPFKWTFVRKSYTQKL